MRHFWTHFWTPPFLVNTKEDPSRFRVFLSASLAMMTTIGSVYFILEAHNANTPSAKLIATASMVVLLGNILALFKHKNPRFSYWILCLTPHLILCEEVWRHGPGAPTFVLLCGSPATFAYFLGLRSLFFVVGSSLLTTVLVLTGIPCPTAALLGKSPHHKPDGLVETLSLVSMLFVGGLIGVYERGRKSAEKTLVEMIEDLETIFTTMSEGIVIQDPSGKIEKHNEAALQTLGLTSDQLNGRTSFDPRWASIKEDGSPFPGSEHPSMIALKTQKPVRSVTMGIFHPHLNQYRWLLINATPMFTTKGQTKKVLATFTDITNELEARKEAKRDSTFLKKLMDHSNMAVTAILEDGTISYINTVGASYLNTTPERLVKQSLYDKAPEFIRKRIESTTGIVFKTAKTLNYEEKFKKPSDGSTRTFNTIIFPLVNESGQVDQVVRIDSDVSEISKTKDSLIETQERLKIATKAINLAIWEIDLETNAFQCDETFYFLYEIEKKDTTNIQSFQQTILASDIDRFRKALRDAIQNLRDVSIGYRIRTPKGSLKHMRLEGKIFLNDEGKAQRMVGSIWDDTLNSNFRIIQKLHRELDQLMLESRDHPSFLARIVEVFTHKLEWDYGAYWEFDRGTQMLGFSGSFWIKPGTTFPLTLKGNAIFNPVAGKGLLGQVLDTKKSLMIRNLLDHQSSISTRDLLGDEVTSLFAVPILLGDDCIGLIEFMSKETQVLHPDVMIAIEGFGHRIGQFLSKLDTELQLVHSSKMSSLGEMAAGVAHEINNPLSVVKGKLNQIRNSIQALATQDPVIAKNLEAIDRNADRIAKIVRGLRAFSREGAQDPYVLTPVQTIINESLDLVLERFKGHGIEITPPILDPQLQIPCRPSQIEQVLINLLINALHAIEKLPLRWIKLDVFNFPRDIEIAITDSGGGIPLDIQNKIFQPFFTTKPQGKGTGLGLSISARIIRAHQGNLSIDRNCSNTRFIISLPKTRTDDGSAGE